jgi:plastocyanin
MKWILATASIAILVAAGAAQAGSGASVVIRHQVRGCHTWSVNGGAFKASQAMRVARGTTVTFTNNDVMPHTLIKTHGPAAVIRHAKMGHMSATATILFSHPGVYVLRTKAGEDYPGMSGMKTIGEDNVLRLTVRVS